VSDSLALLLASLSLPLLLSLSSVLQLSLPLLLPCPLC
jgi:hypothetical protein